MISFLGNIKFQKFSFDRFLLINCIDVFVEIFQGSHVLIFNFCWRLIHLIRMDMFEKLCKSGSDFK